jgi:hypothetical protein
MTELVFKFFEWGKVLFLGQFEASEPGLPPGYFEFDPPI